jgi:hypothetical protein
VAVCRSDRLLLAAYMVSDMILFRLSDRAASRL